VLYQSLGAYEREARMISDIEPSGIRKPSRRKSLVTIAIRRWMYVFLGYMYVLIPKRNQDRIGDAVYLIEHISFVLPLTIIAMMAHVFPIIRSYPFLCVIAGFLIQLWIWKAIKKYYKDRLQYIRQLNDIYKLPRKRRIRMRIISIVSMIILTPMFVMVVFLLFSSN